MELTTNENPPAQNGRARRHYEPVTLLGQGGMARVYLAVTRGPAGWSKLAVVKQIRPELAADRELRTMFCNEARIAARLNHPNVVCTYEVLEEAGQYLMVMEHLEGHTLAEVLFRVGRTQCPLEEHLWILTQVLAGLHYGHELRDYDGTLLGVVHRDVSPSNVFITYNGEVKLLDFGLSRANGALASRHQQSVPRGRLGYAAPEQFQSGKADARGDIYSVGVMLWEAIAGRRRADRRDTPPGAAPARPVAAGQERKIRQVCPETPAELADLVDQATAADPKARFRTAAELQSALERYLETRPRRVGAREVAALVSVNFRADRLAMRKQIETGLSGTHSLAELDPATPPPPEGQGRALPGRASLLTASALFRVRPPAMTPRARIIAAAVIAGAGVFGVGLGLIRRASQERPPLAADTSAPAARAVQGEAFAVPRRPLPAPPPLRVAPEPPPPLRVAPESPPPLRVAQEPSPPAPVTPEKALAVPARRRPRSEAAAATAPDGSKIVAPAALVPASFKVIEPGMDLRRRERPRSRHQLDERDPYSR
jgi:serine/threonine-protein kinase